MGLCKILSISSFLLATLIFFVHAATFNIQNRCSYTVWAAAIPGGGMRLDPGKSWSLNVNAGTSTARIWGRTACNFDGSGKGRCSTGDCGGRLQCQAYGTPPNTLVEYSLNQFNNMDFFDISLVDGFNLPVAFKPITPTSSTSNGCTLEIFDGVYEPLASSPTSSHECSTRGVSCTADIVGQCPEELKAPGGCNNPCIVFKTNQYCCNSGSCEPTSLSKFFKDRCPDAYSYPKDDNTSTLTCPGGTNYEIIFCP